MAVEAQVEETEGQKSKIFKFEKGKIHYCNV